MKKRLLSALLALYMALTLLPGTVFAAEQGLEGSAESTVVTPETFDSLDSSGNVALKAGNYENWIDRVDIPDYARNFYDILIEASDNDGYRDYLIDDQYFDTTRPASDYTELKTGDIYYDAGRTSIVAAVLKAPYDSDWAAADAVYDEASQYVYAAYQAFDRDHNEVFWLDNAHNSWTGKYYSTDRKTATVWILYDLKNYEFSTNLRANNFDAKGIRSAIAATESNIAGILNGIPNGANRYETIAYFNDWLTTHNEYNTLDDLDDGPWDIRAASNALEGKSGVYGPVCESYARAFKLLCDRVGIPCTLVNGEARSTADREAGAHMWNYVQMENGSWYAVDVTWNDPTYTVPRGKVSGGETDKWLLLGEHTLVSTGFGFLQSHPVENYYSRKNIHFTNGPKLNPTAYASLTYKTVEEGRTIVLEAERFPVRKSETSTYSYSVSNGTLPAGLTLDRFTGMISGTLTATVIGDVTVTVTLYENGLAAASRNIVFHGEKPVYAVTVDPVPAGEGAVTVTPTSAKSGEKITITAAPDDGYAVDGVTVTDGSGGRVSVTDNGNGVYTFTMPDSPVTVGVEFAYALFTDVSKSDWFYDGVVYMSRNGLISGVGGGRFDPGDTTNRGMIVTLLYKIEGAPRVTSNAAFTDVPAGQYYTDAVAWAAANNIVSGYNDNTFRPNEKISREQMATILYNYAVHKGYDVSGRSDLSGYADAGSVSSWALTAMRWAGSEGLISGRTATTLVPDGTAKRSEAAVLLTMFCRQIVGME